jgi:hypothetical protein
MSKYLKYGGLGGCFSSILDDFNHFETRIWAKPKHFYRVYPIAILWLPENQEIPKKTPPKKLHQKIHLLKAPPRNLGMDQYQEIRIWDPRPGPGSPRLVG